VTTSPTVQAIKASGYSIYDPITVGDPALWLTSDDLESILNAELMGLNLDYPNRTRSKIAKTAVCQALGYPLPSSFEKTQPRFPGQNFDTYVQKANNLQVWNEELSPTRRYVLIRVDAEGKVIRVKVINGEELAKLDTTGTLTQKFQARVIVGTTSAELISPLDTEHLQPLLTREPAPPFHVDPTDNPVAKVLLPIAEIFDRLKLLVGKSFPDLGYDQDRNRGAALHRLTCHALGYPTYGDNGKFPDIRHQLVEVKLQTAATIDLGLVCPDSTEPLDVPMMLGQQVRHCDVRYAVFYAITDGKTVTLTHLMLTTGEKFFSRFTKFQGKEINKKLQIPLPSDFFDD
jgi:hypothetical protein